VTITLKNMPDNNYNN